MNTTVATPSSEAPALHPPIQKETTVGNYFVSNYPPFSFWKPEHVGELYAALERPPAPGEATGEEWRVPRGWRQGGGKED